MYAAHRWRRISSAEIHDSTAFAWSWTWPAVSDSSSRAGDTILFDGAEWGMIEDRAKELGRLIGQSTEYKEVKRASDALNEDKDTVGLLQKMEQLRVDAQRMLTRGERPTEEMERQLDTLLADIQGRMSYQRLLVAQENFDKTMGKVNDWILEGIERGATSSIITLG